MSDKELIQISIRVDKNELEKLKKTLGLSDTSKCIRASMNFCNNVSHNLFNGNLANMFKRKKENEEVSLFDNSI